MERWKKNIEKSKKKKELQTMVTKKREVEVSKNADNEV